MVGTSLAKTKMSVNCVTGLLRNKLKLFDEIYGRNMKESLEYLALAIMNGALLLVMVKFIIFLISKD